MQVLYFFVSLSLCLVVSLSPCVRYFLTFVVPNIFCD